MRSNRLSVVVASCVPALMAAIYFGVHSPPPHADSHSAATVAVPAATLGTEFATTIKRVDEPLMTAQALAPEQSSLVADPATASGSSFPELRACVYASRDLITAKQIADCSFYEGKPQYEQAFSECLNGWMDIRNRIAAAEAALPRCDHANLGKRYFETTKEAAKNGDFDAQLCYLQGDFFSPEGSLIFTDAEIEHYKEVAPGYVDAALKRGDWRVVELLNKRHFHPGDGPLNLLDGVGERDTRYKLTKLLRLGASGPYAKGLDGELRGMMNPDLNPAAALPPDTIQEGDAWAQRTYADYFSYVPGLTEAPTVCRSERALGSFPDTYASEGRFSR